jgi:hypothetical protein
MFKELLRRLCLRHKPRHVKIDPGNIFVVVYHLGIGYRDAQTTPFLKK